MRKQEPSRKAELYQRLTESALGTQGVTRGTMMGFPCLRFQGRFFASLDRTTADLIVKLPVERVRELMAEGVGTAFAPSGRVFREWVSLPEANEDRWKDLIHEAMEFAAG